MKICVDLGGSHIAVSHVDEEQIVIKKEIDFEENHKKDIENVIINSIVKFANEMAGKEKIDKISISAPGRSKDGVILGIANLDIENLKIANRLKEKLGSIEIKIANDAKCAALCEKVYGALQDYDDALFMCFGTGVGGAVFLDGKMLIPKTWAGFELGHVVIKKDGKKCTCGRNGCLQEYTSMKALREKIRERKNMETITGREAYSIIKNDYDSVKDIVEEYIEDLSIGIINYMNIFVPEAICLGGGFSYFQDVLLDKLIERLKNEKNVFKYGVPKIVTAQFGNDAGLIGASLI